MALVIKSDFETNFGKLTEIYLRIESIYFSRSSGKLNISVNHWINKDSADNFAKKYPEEPKKKNVGLIDEKVLIFLNDEYSEFIFPHSYQVFPTVITEEETPIYEISKQIIETSYVSFDENGEEVENTKIEEVENKTQIGTEIVRTETIDPSIINNVFTYSYNHIKAKLSETFEVDKIADC